MAATRLGTKGPAKVFTALVANSPISTNVQTTLAISGSTAAAVNFDFLSLEYPSTKLMMSM
jgi:hypothetical protein